LRNSKESSGPAANKQSNSQTLRVPTIVFPDSDELAELSDDQIPGYRVASLTRGRKKSEITQVDVPLAALKVLEDAFVSLDTNLEYSLQFAVTEDRAIILVPQATERGCHIYQIRHCALPVVLRNYDRGEFELVGEACLGRSWSGTWVSTIDSPLQQTKQFSRSSTKISLRV
jgi:hypothetical protein